ncbi:TIGR02147 family protein [Pseudobacteriovorax antillogorgiicola]|uniref:TIGR02147 family protein n=1 Tax=Pseudobacteriovorax antillogorgiicola TaxID=1513793 RepID=A0A1Y6CAV3_9BACT|nr:TIGR02147 family protein [Pseudobacteriovorax antillogorgiicola]TCS49075.1 uncharacterized protein (TIGR02147 family) [Pseudobacteriovorax antillogorgiicola]SMF52106.1 TIGR02147 family protein [Pseudobacteriovorax antillogorgiicola]
MNKIYGYTDYRKYLEDYYDFKKSQGKGFSFRQFSRKCGFSSPNFIKLVIEGQRNLSPDSVEKVVKGLDITGSELEYFRILVKLNQENKNEIKAIYFDQLKKITPYEKRRQLDTESVEYLSHWIYPVLREMAAQADFRDDPYWISRRLTGRATVKDIRKALQFLIHHGFIIKNEDGYTTPDKIVLSSDEIRNLAVRQYHRTILRQAQEALDDLEVSDREFGALIITLPESSLGELKDKLKQFRKDIHEWAMAQNDSPAQDEQVIQYNFQMFPQSRKAAKS